MSANQAGAAQPPRAHSPRSIALVGPLGSGKSTLCDALLTAAGAPPARRTEKAARSTGTELRLVHCAPQGDRFSILDCPGSVEFAWQAQCALAAVDLAVVVCEPDQARAAALAPLLHGLDEAGIPHLLFINKIDTLDGHVRDLLAALQVHSASRLVLRQVPIREAGKITGYVDVVSERAYRYRPGQASELVRLPDDVAAREREARAGLLETLADYDDSLMEKILEDITPEAAEIYAQLHRTQVDASIVEVLLGAGERGGGVRRLWKALRHDTPTPAETAARAGIAPEGEVLAQVFRTFHAGHAGKLSLARLWRGTLRDGVTLNASNGISVRLGGILRFPGGEQERASEAAAGELVGLARLEGVPTGATLSTGTPEMLPGVAAPPPVFAFAVATRDRKDDVKLSGALARLLEEDGALSMTHDPEAGEIVLHGQGEMHLNAALERLEAIAGIKLATHRPRLALREAIRQKIRQHARLKRQTGGHGQFADVTLEIEPLPRGEGFRFIDKIVGGAVPRQYIPAVGDAAEQATQKGVFGVPVVDIAVTLVDGGFHTVDSSDMAFRTATRLAMTEAFEKADPILLEPIHRVTVSAPNGNTAGVQRLITGRRGRILGYGERAGWPGWDELEALVPEAELHDMIIELRSLTQGLGTYRHAFDNLAEAHPKLAERARAEAAGAKG